MSNTKIEDLLCICHQLQTSTPDVRPRIFLALINRKISEERELRYAQSQDALQLTKTLVFSSATARKSTATNQNTPHATMQRRR